jgi:integrase
MFMGKVQIVRYVLSTGKRLSKGTRGAKRKVEQSRKFYACFRRNGRRLKVPLSSNRKLAHRMMRELEQNIWRLNLGLVDAYAEHRQTPIAQHVADYLADAKSKGRSPKHLGDIGRKLNAFIEAGRIATLADLHMAKLDAFLNALAKQELSATTRNSYRQTAIGFANWLVSKERLPKNPLLNATKAEGKKTRSRRALSIGELRTLIAAAESRSPARALLYRLAVGTGLRKGELKALRVHHLRLDAEQPHVLLPGEYTKNGKDALLPLTPWLVAALQTATKGKGESQPIAKFPTTLSAAFGAI